MKNYIHSLVISAKDAAITMRESGPLQRNEALRIAALEIKNRASYILDENEKDFIQAKSQGCDQFILARLRLTKEKIDRIFDSIQAVVQLPEVIGVTDSKPQQNGITVGTMRVPIGVIAIIYESRPNVTSECASLCLKSANAVILRGGKESINTNRAIHTCFQVALEKVSLPSGCVLFIDNTDYALVQSLLSMNQWIDLIIPRGGKSLIEAVRKHSTIPRLDHLDGVCHIYLDETADESIAIRICKDAKMPHYAMCNSVETILIHHSRVPDLAPKLVDEYQKLGVEVRACPIISSHVSGTVPATEEDWHTEYLAPIISIKAVPTLTAAIAHIETFGSHHTDAIISKDQKSIQIFQKHVDSSSVMINTSTRLADGFEYGLGAEIGISTAKLHARGPVGLEGLTSKKFIVFSDGSVRN
ncbi:MAG: glutamate-5-semialdehyde dehydrogenase [Methylacidiphilales bacterium]|nr:glutamate-5-semialdehyde dehydrogenase [Candidatus Methylacidiphilales bacterium]